jgi:excisionase family DNA binding protein
MASTPSISSIGPGEVDVEVAGRTARRIRDYLQAHPSQDSLDIHVEGDDSEVLVVPRAGAAMLAQALAVLEGGGGVALVPSRAQLTTQQAADMLNVSRPYLIKLIETGEIPHTKVGRHRRVAFAELMEYKRRSDQKTLAAVDALSDLGQEIGL